VITNVIEKIQRAPEEVKRLQPATLAVAAGGRVAEVNKITKEARSRSASKRELEISLKFERLKRRGVGVRVRENSKL
jgi:hypothetical protein